MKALALLFLGVAGGALAQTAAPPVGTAIVPDTAPGRSLGTIVTHGGGVHTIDGGSLAGSNLFHSFAEFDLAAGDVARWTFGAGDPNAITNVVNRVTGGDPSHLYGTLDSSALPNAAFFFLNPSGILFGPDSQVNVPAASHFSTASELRFADGSAFSVATPSGSTLSVAAPESFGFIGNEGAILIEDANPSFLPASASLSLSASDITINNSIIIGGGFDLLAAGQDGGTFVPGQDSPAGGTISLTHSVLETEAGPDADGAIRVAGKAVTLDGSQLSAFSSADTAGGSIVVAADSLLLRGDSGISTTGVDGTAAGDILAIARRIDIVGGAFLGSRSVDTGGPGSIALSGEEINLSNGRIVSEPYGSGDAGVVLIAGSSSVSLADGSWISTDSIGSGDSGAVVIQTPHLALADSFISADSLGAGDAGGVIVDATDVDLIRSYVTSDAYAEGDGGVVRFTVPGTLTLRDASYLRSNAFAAGDSGGVLLSGGNVLLDASTVSANAIGDGEALLVGLDLTGRLRLENGAEIASNTEGAGSAGGILIAARDVELVGSQIGSEALGDGSGGLVAINASGSMALDEGAAITSDTHGSGDAGGVALTAPEMTVAGESRISSDALGDGNAGGLLIEVDDALVLDRAFVSADVLGAGDGGDVHIKAGSIAMVSGSFVSADSTSSATGDGGDVTITAEALEMKTLSAISSDARGEGNGGNVELRVGELTMTDRASISSLTLGTGDAGSVTLIGRSAEVTDGWINSDAFGAGDAGAVTVALDTLDLRGSRISSEAGASGDSGTVNVHVTGALTLGNAEILTNTIGSGAAGDLDVAAGTILLFENSAISSSALAGSSGPSGNVSVETPRLAVLEGSRITTSADNSNPAGGVVVEAARLLVSGEDSAISSENGSEAGGPAGTILIRTAEADISEGGRITTNSAQGSAGDIVFDMPTDGFLTLSGVGAPGVLETSSGPGTGGVIVIASPFAIISNGGSILALGESGGANVRISSNYFIPSSDRLNRVEVNGDLQFDNAIYDVSAGTVSPDLSVIDASGILRGQCTAVRATGRLSRLAIRPVGPYAPRARPDAAAAGGPGPEGCQ